MNELSPRLGAIAARVPPGSRLTDVGTDHALLPAHLRLAGICPRAIATDLREQPLLRGRENARRLGAEGIEFRLCDGLECVSGEETDCVVIAGMGGDTIAGIVERCPWARTGEKLLILQPMSSADSLRRALGGLGIGITGETLVREEGAIYTVITALGRRKEPFESWEAYASRPLLGQKGGLCDEYMEKTVRSLRRALEGAEKSKKPGDVTRAAEFRRVLEKLG